PKFKNREEIETILKKNISDEEKKNEIANIKNHKTDAVRIIQTDNELDIKEGQIWDNQGKATSWTDINDEHPGAAFMPETTRGITYVLEVEGVEGYKVQYFDYDNLYDKLYGEGMSESQADEIASKLSNDKVYQDLMFLLGRSEERRV